MDRKNFLKNYQQFQLGALITEMPHPLTQGLSDLVQADLPQAVERLKAVDIKALEQLIEKSDLLLPLRAEIEKCLAEGGRLFIGGCGATGRLALLIESLWREQGHGEEVVAFMAGGDVALVHSLEGFEDFPQHGARHLKSLGFTQNDLFVGVTEGGETPYVIGATEAACEISNRPVFFMYCNPTTLLKKFVERSRKVIENKKIHKIDLTVGPMALSGSTRLQASTVLQLGLGWALLESEPQPKLFFEKFLKSLEKTTLGTLVDLIKRESQIYQGGGYVLYVPEVMALTVFTDTTERSPTFSLPSFESSFDQEKVSLCYVMLAKAQDVKAAWHQLLKRTPRPLDWPEVGHHTTEAYLESFDFSQNALSQRESRLNGKAQSQFHIRESQGQLYLSLEDESIHYPLETSSLLLQNTFLKIILNIHSTCLMGRMGRFRSNVMTWVRPSNGKLIDRAARYAQALLAEKGLEVEYLELVEKIFDLKISEGARLQSQSLVELVCDSYLRKKKRSRSGGKTT